MKTDESIKSFIDNLFKPMFDRVAGNHGLDNQTCLDTSATSNKQSAPGKYVDFSKAAYIYGNRNSNPGQRFYIPPGGTSDSDREEACNILCRIINGGYTNPDGSIYSNHAFENDYFAWANKP
jgi:hypothetical protein